METHKYCILCHCQITATATAATESEDDCHPRGGGRDPNSNTSLGANGNQDIELITSFYNGIQISGFSGGLQDTFLNISGDGNAGNHHHYGQLSICGECRPVITTTMERKQLMDEVDENVRKLQLELLKTLNKLKLLVYQFYDDIKGIEERIGSRDQSQYTLGSPLQWNSFEINLFEKRIRQVVKDLSSCQGNRLQIPSPENNCRENLVSPFSTEEIVKPSSSPPTCQESDYDTSSHQSTEENYPDNEIDSDDHTKKRNSSTPKTTTATKNLRIPQKRDFNSAHSTYHPCKTYVINKVLFRKERILTGQPLPRKPGAKTDVEDPRDAYYIDYDPTTDSFSLDGISITLTVTNQKSFHFNCSQCSFLTGQKNPKEKITPFLEILDHVLRLHRQIFQCSQCTRSCYDLTSYREHVRGHQLKYVCDICGKPLQTRKILRQHKWLHLNKEEREQAIKEGAKDPRSLRNQITGTIFQCASCGKGFNRKGNLKLHERTHQPAEEKRKICDKCGKACISYASWLEHWKYCEVGEAGGNFQKCIQCTKCTNTFKNVKGLQSHLRRNHPEEGREKGKKCETCGKGFWTMGELKKHLSTHGDDRPFECGKGCGMRFKLRGTWRHHQKCCDGSGTRPGPKNGKRKRKEVK